MLKNCIVDNIKDFTEYKLRASDMAELFVKSELLKDRAVKLKACGTTIGLSYNEETEAYSVAAANFCRQRLCPACQKRRSLRTYSTISRVYELAEKAGYRFLHLVLTVPNCSGTDLSNTIDKLYKLSSFLFRKNTDIHIRAMLHKTPELEDLREKIAKSFRGVFRALEVTWREGVLPGDPNAFHPHLHCLVAVRKSYFTSRDYISHSQIQRVWAALTGIENVQLYISKVTDSSQSIAEVSKYCVKPINTAPPIDVLEILHTALHSRRMTQSYGIFKEWLQSFGAVDLEEVVDDPRASVSVWLSWGGGEYCLEEC
jgi:plasmid rolling circle replication initiator protein Rep